MDAIVGAVKKMHTVIAADCTGCDLCIAPCPTDCIELIPLAPEAIESATHATRYQKNHQLYQKRQARKQLKKQLPTTQRPEIKSTQTPLNKNLVQQAILQRKNKLQQALKKEKNAAKQADYQKQLSQLTEYTVPADTSKQTPKPLTAKKSKPLQLALYRHELKQLEQQFAQNQSTTLQEKIALLNEKIQRLQQDTLDKPLSTRS